MKENKAEEIVSKFYNEKGWNTDGSITEDAQRWEDLREYARDYVRKCRLRVLNHIPEKGEKFLDMASGPIQYREYLEYSRSFEKRYCVDLSAKALDSAREKIGNHGEFLHGSFFDIFLEDNLFDCAVSLHTIYHMDKDKQEDAVRKLLRVTKPGKPVIIVYSNATPFIRYLKLPLILLLKARDVFSVRKSASDIYYHAHPITWWERFADCAEIKILPWRSFSANDQKRLIPNTRMGGKLFAFLFNLENKYPDFFVKYFQYPMVVLTKKKA